MNTLVVFPWMQLQGEQGHSTESYVSSPPALTIIDSAGDLFCLGFNTAPKGNAPNGEFAFNVLVNGLETGEVASRIEMRNGRVKIFSRDGWKIWNGATRSFF